jgi:serralysin
VMTGGLGADVFRYFTAADAAANATPALRDRIADFSVVDDTINLALVDANTGVAGDQAFSFIGSGAFTTAGQIRYSGGVLEMNVGGTLAADMQITMTGAPVLTVADFVL